jgi:hypothetical protein
METHTKKSLYKMTTIISYSQCTKERRMPAEYKVNEKKSRRKQPAAKNEENKTCINNINFLSAD